MIEITSAENKVFKHIRKLYTGTYREKCGETILEGERLVTDSAAYGGKLSAVFVRENYTGRVPECSRIYTLSQKLFDSLAETKTPQGILATACAEFAAVESVFRGGLVVVCDRVQDPGNLGTIFRTAHAVGADGVVLIRGCADPFSPKTVRSSMGSVFALPVCMADTLPAEKGYQTFCGTLSEKAVPLYSVSFPRATMLILGNEANGASEAVINAAENHVILPMPGGAESLNVAAAGAAMMYEYLRQVEYV